REDLDERIENVEAELAEREQLKTDREELRGRLETLRGRVDRLETEAVEAFNDHMDAVLETLGYDNLDRIWIERTTEPVTEGRRTVEESAFELHVVRSTDDGRAYEDTVGHLSESEREVTGLVFALAGYLVHEVHEELPFMILDSLEAIDADRIAALVDYLSEYAETVVVALLPEDAQALDDDYHRVTEI
ncbi:MAG: chromosome segregation protein SMC, partial [Halohasta sp.]